MFDISFSELLLIGLVALVVLGPERLPTVARTLGALAARAQRFASSVKADIAQQTELASLSSLRHEVRDAAYAFKNQFENEIEQARASITDQPAALETALSPPALVNSLEPDQNAAHEMPPARQEDPSVESALSSAPDTDTLDLFSDLAPPLSSRDTHS